MNVASGTVREQAVDWVEERIPQARIQEWIQAAIPGAVWNPHHGDGEITYRLPQGRADKYTFKNCSELTIGSNKEIVTTRINHRAISAHHVTIRRRHCGWTLIREKNTGAVFYFKDGSSNPVELAPGASMVIFENEFHFEIPPYHLTLKGTATKEIEAAQFSFSSSNAEEPVTEETSLTWMTVLGTRVALLSPVGFWDDAEASAVSNPSSLPHLERAVLSNLWERIEKAFGIRPSPLEYPFNGNVEHGGDEVPRRFIITALAGGARHRFELSVPLSLFRNLWNAAPENRDELRAQLSWRILLLAGERRLTIGQLRALGPGSVVILAAGPAMICPEGRVRWVFRHDDLSDRYIISDRLRDEIAYGCMGTPNTSLDVEALEVLVQVVLEESEIKIADIAKLGIGRDIAVGLGPGKAVKIALNGRVLGSGELVAVSGAKLGVRVTGWDV